MARREEDRARAAREQHEAGLQRLRDEATRELATADFTARNPLLEAQLRTGTDNDQIAAHLVYADWLESRSNPIATLIRLQIAHAPTDQVELWLRLCFAITGQLREPYVTALGPVIEIGTVRELERRERHPLVEDLIDDCHSLIGPGVNSVTPPAQAFSIGGQYVALSRGFATRLQLEVYSADQLRRILNAPFAALVSHVQVTLQAPIAGHVAEAIEVFETAPAAAHLRTIRFANEAKQPLEPDRSKLPHVTKFRWA
ncbi:MAG TPA: hypothetical protein VGC41_02580 [Kofleriaceae bacterium]